MIKAENLNVQVEVEGDLVVLVLDRKHDCLLIPWQDAFILAATLHQAIGDVQDLTLVDVPLLKREQGQILLREYQGMVALIFDHTDRVKFHWPAACAVRDAIKCLAQDIEYSTKECPLAVTTPTRPELLPLL